VLNDLPGRRLRQQAWLERLRIGVGQQELGRTEAELTRALRDAGALGRRFVLRLGGRPGRRLGRRLGRCTAGDAREGDLLVAEQQQRS
jgi:hypothetical protein